MAGEPVNTGRREDRSAGRGEEVPLGREDFVRPMRLFRRRNRWY